MIIRLFGALIVIIALIGLGFVLGYDAGLNAANISLNSYYQTVGCAIICG